MEKFACKSLGIECDFEATGETKQEVLAKAMDHGGAVHADLMAEMTEEQSADFVKQLEASIHPV